MPNLRLSFEWLENVYLEEISDVMIGSGYYRLLSIYIRTFDVPIDAQSDGNWGQGMIYG
jgi:hypothetical protein